MEIRPEELQKLNAFNHIFVSISGGKTSAYMAIKLKDLHVRGLITPPLTFIFANTSSEHAKTYEFLERVDLKYGLGIKLLEAQINPLKGRGTGFRLCATYSELRRDNSLYESSIRKYGIPNLAFPSCTRELKLHPLRAYARTICPKGVCFAVGIRTDEEKRRSKSAQADKVVYPLLDLFPSDKEDVNSFFEGQEVQLEIASHLGNCVFCFKKSLSKLAQVYQEQPEAFEFPARIEKEYGQTNNFIAQPRVFFRGNRSTTNLIKFFNSEELKQESRRPSPCETSCEAF